MYTITVSIQVHPHAIASFITATLANARATRREPANLRFDVSQSIDDPAHFLLYECYTSQDGFTTHQQTDHYLLWKQSVADLMATPRQAAKYHPLFFNDTPTDK